MQNIIFLGRILMHGTSDYLPEIASVKDGQNNLSDNHCLSIIFRIQMRLHSS